MYPHTGDHTPHHYTARTTDHTTTTYSLPPHMCALFIALRLSGARLVVYLSWVLCVSQPEHHICGAVVGVVIVPHEQTALSERLQLP